MIPIFHTYTLNEFLTDTQLSVDLGLYFLPGSLLSYIVILLYAVLVLYSLYLIISAIWIENWSPGAG